MKGPDRSVYEISVLYDFRLSELLSHSTTGGETAKKWITNFKIKLSQFIAQMFQAGTVTECAAALLSFRYPSDTGKPEQNFTTKIHAKRDDGSVVWHLSSDPRVLRGAMHSG